MECGLYGLRRGERPRRRMADGSLTLERGLKVLRALADQPDGLSVSELAAELETHRAGIYRLVTTLGEQRLVVRGADGRYALGVAVLELASAVRSRLQEVAVRELRVLADEVRATTALTLRDGDEAVVASVVEPTRTDMHIAYRPGLRHPIDCAAPGLAILAGGPSLPGERPEVQLARSRGWAVSSGELLPGAIGVAAPIPVPGRDADACISAVWIEARDTEWVAEQVVQTAAAIGAAL